MEYNTAVYLILGIYFFVIGAIFGSFLNMLVYRINKGEKIFGRSYCDYTKKPLKVIDLIPIFSFLIFKGKCRDCHKKIPFIYPFIEILTGLVSLLAFLKVSTFINITEVNIAQILLYWFLIFIICFVFIFFGYYDYLYWEIDSRSIYLSLILLVVFNIVNFFQPLPFLSSTLDNILGGVILAGFIFIIFKLTSGGGMGEGDIYLFGLVGLSLGFSGGVLALTLTSIIGSIVGLLKALIQQKKVKGLKIQLAPFITIGCLIVFFLKDQIFRLVGFF